MDVGIRAVLNGFDEAKKQVSDLNKELERTETVSKNVGTAGTAGGKGLGELANTAEKASGELEGLSVNGARAAGVIGTVLVAAVGYAVKSFVEGFNHVRALGDELDRLSQQTGISAQRLSEWQLVAATNNMTIGQLGNSVQTFNKHIIDATRESGRSAEAFETIGISIRDSSGALKDNEKLLKEVAERFRTMEDGAGKTAFAMDFFGASGKALIPILNQGAAGLEKLEAEAKKAGITMTNDTAKAAAELNANLEVLKAYGQGFWVSVASPFIKGLAEMTRVMRELRGEGSGLFGALFGALSTPTLDSVQGQQQTRIKNINRLEGQLSSLPADAPIRAQLERQLQTQYAALQDLYKREGWMRGEGEEGPQSLSPAPDRPVKTPRGAKGKDPLEELRRSQDMGLRMAMDAMDLEIKAERSTAEEKIALIDAVLAADVGSTTTRMQLLKERERAEEDIKKKGIKNIQDQQKAEETAARMDAEVMRGAERAAKEFADKQIEEIKRTSLSHEELQRRLQELEDEYRELGGAGYAAYERVREENKKMTDETAKNAARMREVFGKSTFDMIGMFGTFHQSVANAFAGIIRGNESVGSAIVSVWKSTINSIIGELGRLLANDVFKAIFGIGPGGIFTGSAGVGGSIGSSLLGSVGSSAASAVLGGGGGGGAGILSGILGGGGGASAGGSAAALAAEFEATGGLAGAAAVEAGAAAGGAGLLSSAASFLGPIGLAIGGGLLLKKMFGKSGALYSVISNTANLNGSLSRSGFAGSMSATEVRSNGYGSPTFTGVQAGEEVFNNHVKKMAEAWNVPADTVIPFSYSGPMADLYTKAEEVLLANSPRAGWGKWSRAMFGEENDLYLPDGEGGRRRVTLGDDETAPFDLRAAFSSSSPFGRGYAMGGDTIVTRPTLLSVGELGAPERVQVTPLANSRGGGGKSGITIMVNGLSIMDNYSARRLAYELQRLKA